MSGKKISLDEFIETANSNINSDRALTSKLLFELMQEMGKSQDKYIHKEFGDIAASYVETLQRSNEQLVKLTAILQRRESVQTGLDEAEKDNIFDMINKKGD
jgi:hypothetical protein